MAGRSFTDHFTYIKSTPKNKIKVAEIKDNNEIEKVVETKVAVIIFQSTLRGNLPYIVICSLPQRNNVVNNFEDAMLKAVHSAVLKLGGVTLLNASVDSIS